MHEDHVLQWLCRKKHSGIAFSVSRFSISITRCLLLKKLIRKQKIFRMAHLEIRHT